MRRRRLKIARQHFCKLVNLVEMAGRAGPEGFKARGVCAELFHIIRNLFAPAPDRQNHPMCNLVAQRLGNGIDPRQERAHGNTNRNEVATLGEVFSQEGRGTGGNHEFFQEQVHLDCIWQGYANFPKPQHFFANKIRTLNIQTSLF